MIALTDNLEINKPAPVDDRLGVFVSTAEALSYIAEDRRYVGLTLIIDSGSGATEYWFENGVQDGDLTAKSTGGGGATWGTITGTLSNQTDLQTALDAKANTSSLATVATSGSYNDLSNLPTIPSAQVNSDWNAVSGVAQILNKPTIPTSLPPSGNAGGDLTGTYPDPTVHRVHGVDFQSGTPNAGDVWIYGGSPAKWQHQSLTKSDVGLGNVPNLDATNPANISQSSSYRFVTDAEKSTWNGKQNSLGFTPENVANKQTDLTASATKYPTVDAVNSGLATKVNSNSAITGATKTKITYDSKGLVTAGADITIADIPTTLPVAYSSPVVSILSGGVITETQLTTITIPAGAFKNGDNILSTFWASRTTGASSGVSTALVIRITNSSGTQIASVSTGNRHNNFTLNARVLSDTSIIWWANSATASAVITTTPSLASSGFTVYIGITRTNTTDEVTLYNSIIRKYS